MTYLTELFAAIRRREEGQTMAEYGVILAVITVLIIGALLLLSSGIERNIMSVVNVISAFRNFGEGGHARDARPSQFTAAYSISVYARETGARAPSVLGLPPEQPSDDGRVRLRASEGQGEKPPEGGSLTGQTDVPLEADCGSHSCKALSSS
jgi:Flp pilus assembly pilin Flp